MQRRIRDYQTDGRIYVLDLDAAAKRKSAWINLVYVLIVAVAQVLAGMVNQTSSRTAWVVYPYLMIYLPLAYAFMGVFTYWGATSRMSGTQYHEGILRIRRSLLAIFVLALIGALLGVLYLVLHRADADVGSELLYLGLHLPHILGVIAYGRYYDRTFTGLTVEQ